MGHGLVDIDVTKVEYLRTFKSAEKMPYDDMVFHYNIDTVLRQDATPVLELLKSAGHAIQAFILVTPETELRERLLHRGTTSGRSDTAYLRCRKQLQEPILPVYQEWVKRLHSFGITTHFVKSSAEAFTKISHGDLESTLAEEVTLTNTKHSKHQIEMIIAEGDFQKYHRVELPYGLSSSGQEVWNRFNLVFARSLKAQSVLDIGCANGAFSFEAERRGAVVTAADVSPTRLRAAKQFGSIIGSSVSFTDKNYLEESSEETFDIVLLLNVLHHVVDPGMCIRKAASLAKRYLIVEFPTSKDPLYQDKEMRRVVGPFLIEELSLFTNVKLIPSPKEERVIAICSKQSSEAWPATKATSSEPRRGTPRHETILNN